MKNFIRKECPIILIEPFSKTNQTPRWVVYGERYAKQQNRSYYNYPTINNQKLNNIILPILMEQTDNHCSYCDGFPLLSADETIDHFKPKSKFPHEVCRWENLYIACAHCQHVKGTQYDDLLLRPDETTYNFNDYFFYDYTEHKIKILPSLPADKLRKAEITCEILSFNHKAMVESRIQSYEGFNDKPDYPRELLAYRFIFE
ncbi:MULTISPECIES: HNH endonuclease [unclassified Arcicella]|uniref:HNH endonuclease n=1 Tax=unclassified Arcicella TaxID=2644986 RepID=UPI0028670996|nr:MULTISPECIES: HNH endonuclease [unclassified Arcicella]MDR6562824.1 uncharacterized protein (TIGR02646 family) [Arcicella sp. BE51]MDR6812834.1 uncharacterized protein (TIGR02646 family) [Arcicella sp. BE140]MDR6824146.1 uncharacterized protein (TIGR02646 family) [Arcicella sp. BE139]